MVSIEMMVPLARLVLVSKLSDSHNRSWDVEALEKRRHIAENKWLSYEKQTNKAYNMQVRPRILCLGDLVLKAAGPFKKA